MREAKFGPEYLPGTIDELAVVITPPEVAPGAAEVDAQIAGCDRKLAQYRAALDAGAEPGTVAHWITKTEAERARYQAVKRAAAPQLAPAAMSRDEIASVVNALSDALVVLRSAAPADKAQIYAGLGLRLIYQPGERLVGPRSISALLSIGNSTVSEGRLHPNPNACSLVTSQLGAGHERGARPGESAGPRLDAWHCLALIADSVSYLHVHTMVAWHGQPGWVAALTPLSVNGMMVVDHVADGLSVRAQGAVGTVDGGECHEFGGERGGRPAHNDRPGDCGVAELALTASYELLPPNPLQHHPCADRWNSAPGYRRLLALPAGRAWACRRH